MTIQRLNCHFSKKKKLIFLATIQPDPRGTPQPSASSHSTCRFVSKSLATGAPSKDPITRWRWCESSPTQINSMVFLEAMAGVSPQERFTDSQLYNVLYQELLVAALPGRRSESSQPRLWRWNTWWSAPRRLVTVGFSPGGSWSRSGPLRFSDHRGILPDSVKIEETGFSAQLTRSKRPWARTAQPPLDRSSSTAVAIWPSPAGCRRGGACSTTWQTTSSLFRLPTGTGAEDESCRTTQLPPCRTESCAWSDWVMSHCFVPPPHVSGRRTQCNRVPGV